MPIILSHWWIKTTAALGAFILAMIRFPEVQKRAQAELDAVLGNGRLPTFDDKTRLPYISAILYETLRWHNIIPSKYSGSK